MRATQHLAAVAAGLMTLVVSGTAVLAQPRVPQQRGFPPGQDTPYIIVTAFQAPDRKLSVDAGDEMRNRLQDEHSAKELFVVTKTAIEKTLEASGYPVDTALSINDIMQLSRSMHGEYAVAGHAVPTGQGKGVRMNVRLMMWMGQQIVTQPLPEVEGKDLGDAAKQVEREMTAALKQVPMYKDCLNAGRAAKYDEAAAKARAGIAAYPAATWSRICLLNTYVASKSAPPDSIIAVGTQILAADSTSMLALANLADAYKAREDHKQTAEMLRRMLRLDPSNRAVLTALLAEIAPLDPTEGIALVDELLRDTPNDAELLDAKWKLQLRKGDFANAIATGEQLVKADTARATLDYFNRQIGAAQSDSNRARIIELASRATQKFPKDISFPTLLSQTYYRSGQLQEAFDAAMRATAIDPKDSRGWQFAMVAAKDMNQNDSVMAIGVRALAAGADKAQIGPMMLAPAQAALNKAQESKTRADWQEALRMAELVDSIAPSKESKFFIGVSSFQVAFDMINELQPLTKSTKDADHAAACTLAQSIDDNLAKTQVAMPQGGAVKPDVAAQILGNIGQFTEFTGSVKKAFCK